MTIIKTIIFVLSIFVAFLMWCACRVGGLEDRKFEEYWREEQQKKNQEANEDKKN